MNNFFETITKRLAEWWQPDESPDRWRSYRSYRCQCGRPVFFRNSICLACKTPLGYFPELGQVKALEPGEEVGTWVVHGQNIAVPRWRRCKNFDTPAVCNWMVPSDENVTLCASCRLNRTIPDLHDVDNCLW